MTTAYITHDSYVEHDLPNHPEHAGRIRAVWDHLERTGLAARMTALDPVLATDAQILTVHTQDYLDLLNSVPEYGGPVRFDADTYALPTSPAAARYAAGGVVRAVDAVLGGEAQNALAVVRPPGHHAVPDRAMGFCLLGNIAIGARHARAAHPVERVLIVDYDVHHGNGTQDMFYGDADVLFVSTHQHPFYPGTGSLQEIGTAGGLGYTVNIPMPGGQGDARYATIYQEIVWPLARRYRPDLIMVSAGHDAHWRDPLAMMRLSLTGYDHLNRELLRMADELCGGRIVFVMEGGYDLDVLSYGVGNIAHALLGDEDIDDPLGQRGGAEPEIGPLLEALRDLHDL